MIAYDVGGFGPLPYIAVSCPWEFVQSGPAPQQVSCNRYSLQLLRITVLYRAYLWRVHQEDCTLLVNLSALECTQTC